jgi:hypothetical protein
MRPGRSSLIRGLAAALLVAAPLPAAAQKADLIPAGARVRLLAVGGYRADGSLVELTPDSIVLRNAQTARLGLHIAALRRVEARLPTGTVWRATRRGFLVGATVGVIATGAAAIIKGGALDVPLTIPIIVGSTVAGTVGGALFMRGYAWEVIPLRSLGQGGR